MYRNNKTTGNKVNGKKVVPSCPHCENLGLKNDHWLRENSSPDSDIVCPILLKTECRYCHKMGHNISKCQRLAESKKQKQEKNEKEKEKEKEKSFLNIDKTNKDRCYESVIPR